MKTFVKHYKLILQVPVLALFITVFYFGGFDLFSFNMDVLPIQVMILLANYPVTMFCIKCTNLEYEIEKYKKEHNME